MDITKKIQKQSVTRCNISFGARGFRSAALLSGIVSPLTSVPAKLSQHSAVI